MENKHELKYNFSDFTTSHYRDLIKLAKKNYTFIKYPQAKLLDNYVIWRHDIDFSPHRSLRLAMIEFEEGVTSTYFVHLHNEFYNLFEKEVFETIKKIISLGHDIGVHFDSHFYAILNEEEIEKHLKIEKNILEQLFEVKISSFSFHNTSPFVLSCRKWEYAGLINAYSDFFQSAVTYCSDSNGYWRFNRMYDVINEGSATKLHLLTHPEWWQEEVMSPWQKIQRAIEGRALSNKNYYKRLLAKSKMKNIDWDCEIF